MWLCCSPAGWDSEKKISVLYEHMKTLKPDDEYEDRILRPSVRKGSHEVEVAAEEDNFFLMRLQVRMELHRRFMCWFRILFCFD